VRLPGVCGCTGTTVNIHKPLHLYARKHAPAARRQRHCADFNSLLTALVLLLREACSQASGRFVGKKTTSGQIILTKGRIARGADFSREDNVK